MKNDLDQAAHRKSETSSLFQSAVRDARDGILTGNTLALVSRLGRHQNMLPVWTIPNVYRANSLSPLERRVGPVSSDYVFGFAEDEPVPRGPDFSKYEKALENQRRVNRQLGTARQVGDPIVDVVEDAAEAASVVLPGPDMETTKKVVEKPNIENLAHAGLQLIPGGGLGMMVAGGGLALLGLPVLPKKWVKGRKGLAGGGKSGQYTSLLSAWLRHKYPSRFKRPNVFTKYYNTMDKGAIVGRTASDAAKAGGAILGVTGAVTEVRKAREE